MFVYPQKSHAEALTPNEMALEVGPLTSRFRLGHESRVHMMGLVSL